MLSDTQIKEIAGLLKIDAAAFSEAVKATEEKPVTIPTGLVVLDDAGLTRLKNDEYNNGKTAGVEMAIKDYKEKSGLDFTGKTLDGLVGAIQKKTLDEAKIKPDEKVAQLEKDVETLRATNTDLTAKLQEKDGAVASATSEREIYRQLGGTLGENALPLDKVVKLMKSDGYDFKTENNETVVYLNGQPVKDKVAQVIPLKDVITGYAKENKLITESTPPAGRGGTEPPAGAVFSKLSELKAQYTKEGKSLMGQEFISHAQKLKKENPEFDMAN